MKRNILNSFLIAAVLFTLASCKAKKIIVATPPVAQQELPETNKKLENIQALQAKDLSFNTLALKGKADLDIDGDINSVTMNIRIRKDQTIWANITALGGALEVARALVTPDSIKLINRMQKTYTKKPFSYINEFTNHQIDFSLLQSVFSGNTIKAFMNESSDLKFENGVWNLSGKTEDLVYAILFNTLLKPAETNLNDAEAGQALKVSYEKYTPLNGGLFPSKLNLQSMAGAKKIALNLEFTKIEGNTNVDFPFTVPKSYQLIK